MAHTSITQWGSMTITKSLRVPEPTATTFTILIHEGCQINYQTFIISLSIS